MGSILTAIEDRLEERRRQKEAERHRRLAETVKANFQNWLAVAENDRSELDFWLWFDANKAKIARNRKLIDIIG